MMGFQFRKRGTVPGPLGALSWVTGKLRDPLLPPRLPRWAEHLNHLLSSACSGLRSLHPVASEQLPGCSSQEAPPLARHKGPPEARPCYTHSLGWLSLVIHCTRPRRSRAEGHPYPASLSKASRTLSPAGAPPFLDTEHGFLALELGHGGTKGVDTFLLPCTFHRGIFAL